MVGTAARYSFRSWAQACRAFAFSSGLTLACGGGLLYATRCWLRGGLTLRQALVLTPLSWTVVALFGALPLAFSGYGSLEGSFTNAFFESMSGLTTTGSTVIVGLNGLRLLREAAWRRAGTRSSSSGPV